MESKEAVSSQGPGHKKASCTLMRGSDLILRMGIHFRSWRRWTHYEAWSGGGGGGGDKIQLKRGHWGSKMQGCGTRAGSPLAKRLPDF